MATYHETGHAKNVATFEDLISFVKGLGAKYNPSMESITLTGLSTLHANAKEALSATRLAQTAFNTATNKRAEAFEPLRDLSMRLVAAYSIYANDADINDLKGIHRKIMGQRAGKKKEPVAPVTNDVVVTPSEKSISVSQLSYDSKIDHLEKMVETVKNNAAYKPNEEELSVEGLRSKLSELQAANTAVIDTYTGWSNARITRNDVLYNTLTGLVATAKQVKSYVKSLYGNRSPQHKQLTGLKFTKGSR